MVGLMHLLKEGRCRAKTGSGAETTSAGNLSFYNYLNGSVWSEWSRIFLRDA